MEVEEAAGLAFGEPEGGEGFFEFVEERAGLRGGRAGRDERAELQDEVARRLLPRLLEPTDA